MKDLYNFIIIFIKLLIKINSFIFKWRRSQWG